MKILHLTDIHADIQQPKKFLFRFQSMVKAITQLPSDWKPDIIALTGDFCYHASEQEFQLAELCIRMLFEETNLSGSQTISCEGNHDAEYTDTYNSFVQYEQFLQHMGISNRSLSIGETSIFSINTCTWTTPDLYNHAVLTNTVPDELPRDSVLIMHHPPHFVTPSCKLDNMVKDCRLILSGHIHPEVPSVTPFKNAISLNGCAFTPAELDSSWGCQLIRYSSNTPHSPIEIGSLLTSSGNPDFHFSIDVYSPR